MRFTLEDAARYWATSRVSRSFLAFVAQVRRVFSFTEERANRLKRFPQIVDDYRDGIPVAEIETKYGCSRQTVLRYARLAGLEKRPKSDIERRRGIIALYQQKKPIAEIAARMGVSQALVSKIATEEGINRRKFGKKAAQ
jgi:DNA invertase Pin-like site-specific DNA recombinase